MSLSAFIGAALAAVPVDDPHPYGALLRSDLKTAQRAQSFRRAALWYAATGGLNQREDEVSHYLAGEFDDRSTPPRREVSAFTDDEDEDDGETTDLSGFPTAEVMCVADDVSLRPSLWVALRKELPRHPLAWFSRRVFWRTRDHLIAGAIPVPAVLRPPPEAGHYAVAYQLWVLETLDAQQNADTPTPSVRGVYTDTLRQVRDIVDEAGSRHAQDAPSYALRKLFPRHGWRAHPSAPNGPDEAWLCEAIQRTEPNGSAWAAAVERGTGAPSSGSDLLTHLDASALHHRQRSTAPPWPEVLTWSGHAAIVHQRGPAYTLCQQRCGQRVTRINRQVLAAVTQVVDELKSQHARKETA